MDLSSSLKSIRANQMRCGFAEGFPFSISFCGGFPTQNHVGEVEWVFFSSEIRFPIYVSVDG